MNQIRCELIVFCKATAIGVKKAARKLKFTKYIENLYYILVAVSGKEPPYIKREIEDKIVRVFKLINRVWCSIERDSRKTFMKESKGTIPLVILFAATKFKKMSFDPPAGEEVKTRCRRESRKNLWPEAGQGHILSSR